MYWQAFLANKILVGLVKIASAAAVYNPNVRNVYLSRVGHVDIH